MTIDTDIIVVGGGSAGVAAAVAASKAGLQVILLERNNYLGGKATAAEVGTVCGLYLFSQKKPSEYIVDGYAREFAEQLQIASASMPLQSLNGLHYLPYKVEAFKSISLEQLITNHVTVYYNCIVIHADSKADSVTQITAHINGIETIFRAKAFIDCSGESIISKTAVFTMLASERFQAAAQVFTVTGIPNTLSEASLGMLLLKELTAGIKKGFLPAYADRLYVVQGSLQNGKVSLKAAIPIAVDGSMENIHNLRSAALAMINQVIDFLVTHVPAFATLTVESIAPEVGIRSGLRGKGKYILTEEDVLTCRKFDDAIANGSWPIEEWVQDKRVRMQYFQLDDYYQIPAGCLQSSSANNLFFGGRQISASDGAIASARVIGICMQTGYAAGMLAADYLKNETIHHTINTIQKQQVFI